MNSSLDALKVYVKVMTVSDSQFYNAIIFLNRYTYSEYVVRNNSNEYGIILVGDRR